MNFYEAAEHIHFVNWWGKAFVQKVTWTEKKVQ